MKAIWTALIFCLATCNLSHANLSTEVLDQVAKSRAVSLEENPIEWTRDSTPTLFAKYRLYISELEKFMNELMEVYYYEEDWISYGPQRIKLEAAEFAILDYPGRTIRGASRFEGNVLRFQISTLEDRITLIANRVFKENNDQEGYSHWLKVWESRSKWVEEGGGVNSVRSAHSVDTPYTLGRMSFAQVFPGMVWGALMAPVALVAFLCGTVSIVLAFFRGKAIAGHSLALLAIALSVIAPVIYLIGSDGDGTIRGAIVFGSPSALGLIGVWLHLRASTQAA